MPKLQSNLVYIQCKSDVRSFILHLDEKLPGEEKFVVSFKRKSDETAGLLVKQEYLPDIEERVKEFYRTLDPRNDPDHAED